MKVTYERGPARAEKVVAPIPKGDSSRTEPPAKGDAPKAIVPSKKPGPTRVPIEKPADKRT